MKNFSENGDITTNDWSTSRVPVGAINEGGPTETVIDGKTGYLVDANKDKIAPKKIRFK